ncbi:MAG: L,D-transpeptidase [Chitinophagaceae bacterium]|nr:L,D-transpeptidase [Chitinophagaceae bacterium]
MRTIILPFTRSFFVVMAAGLLFSCAGSQKPGLPEHFDYRQFRDSLLRLESPRTTDTSNLFDNAVFIPGRDSLDQLLQQFDTIWKEEAHLIAQMDTVRKKITTTAGYTEEEKAIIRANIREVDSFLIAKDSTTSGRCHGSDCILYVEIDKAKQQLYLNILGERKDTFNVSTGKGKKYETPAMELNPEGPVLTKYTSRKFPGGNYQGLGNMPYAVFLRNGYAIHGTTPGNFSKLGTPASHGCIRLHPDHAKVLNALVRTIGIRQTWVAVRDSI